MSSRKLDGVAARAESLVKGRRYEEALALCRRELTNRPSALEVRLVFGRALMALHRDDEAETEMNEVIRRSPRCAEGYRVLGELAFRRDQHERAAEFLGEAVRLAPNDAASMVLLDIVREVGARQTVPETPAAAAAKLPAAAAAARRSSSKKSRKAVPEEIEEPKTSALRREDGPSVVVRLRGGLGEFLVRRGVLSRERLFLALGDHYQNGGRIGDAVVRLGFAARKTVELVAAEYIAAQNRSIVAA
jgi:tetratricopeptide (TPR) repeat protein